MKWLKNEWRICIKYTDSRLFPEICLFRSMLVVTAKPSHTSYLNVSLPFGLDWMNALSRNSSFLNGLSLSRRGVRHLVKFLMLCKIATSERWRSWTCKSSVRHATSTPSSVKSSMCDWHMRSPRLAGVAWVLSTTKKTFSTLFKLKPSWPHTLAHVIRKSSWYSDRSLTSTVTTSGSHI